MREENTLSRRNKTAILIDNIEIISINGFKIDRRKISYIIRDGLYLNITMMNGDELVVECNNKVQLACAMLWLTTGRSLISPDIDSIKFDEFMEAAKNFMEN